MKNKVANGIIWRFLERFSAQIVTFVVSIVLARILSPTEFGQVAIIIVILNLLNVFIDGGFGNTLIQKKDADELDFSSVFFFNFVMCIFIYLALFFLAPAISLFYKDSGLTILIRVLGIQIIFSGLKNIQQAYVAKHFLFKRFFWSTFIGTLISAVIGLLLAYDGYGVWAIIWQHLSNIIIDTLILWFTVKWKPKLMFSFKRLKKMFSFGYKLLISSVINTLYANFRQLIIGRIYSSEELAYYNRGKQIPSLIITNINTSIDSVLFPAMAEKQDDMKNVREIISKSIRISTLVLLPILFGIAAIATQLIHLLLTDKWNDAVPYLQVFCMIFATYPLQTANINSLKAIGRSDLVLKLGIIEVIIGIGLMLSVAWISPLWIAIMYLITACLNYLFVTFATKRLFDYGIIKQFKDFYINFLSALLMFAAVYFLGYLNKSSWFIIVQIFSGIIIYSLLIFVFNKKDLRLLLSFVSKKNESNEVSEKDSDFDEKSAILESIEETNKDNN